MYMIVLALLRGEVVRTAESVVDCRGPTNMIDCMKYVHLYCNYKINTSGIAFISSSSNHRNQMKRK